MVIDRLTPEKAVKVLPRDDAVRSFVEHKIVRSEATGSRTPTDWLLVDGRSARQRRQEGSVQRRARDERARRSLRECLIAVHIEGRH